MPALLEIIRTRALVIVCVTALGTTLGLGTVHAQAQSAASAPTSNGQGSTSGSQQAPITKSPAAAKPATSATKAATSPTKPAPSSTPQTANPQGLKANTDVTPRAPLAATNVDGTAATSKSATTASKPTAAATQGSETATDTPKPQAEAPSAPAVVQSNQTSTERARLVYDQAVAAYEAHKYRDAIDLFLQADALKPNPAFSFNIGTAYEDMGDSAMALAYYRSYLRQLPKASDREDVENRIRRLEGQLADKGLQQVTIISQPSDAVVILDGKPRGVTPWTGEIAPGAHVVTLSLSGYAEVTRDFDLPSRRSIDVPVTLKKPEPKVEPVVEVKEPEFEHKSSWEYVRPVTWGVLGVSVASFGAALGFELARTDQIERSRRADTEAGRTKFHDEAARSEVWAKSFLMFAIGMGATSLVLGYQNIDDGLQAENAHAKRNVSFGCSSLRDCGVSVTGSF